MKVKFLSTNLKPRTVKMSDADAGRKGGQKTSVHSWKEYNEEIGRKGGDKVSAERSPEFNSEIAAKAFRTCKTARGAPELEAKQPRGAGHAEDKESDA
jgi:general stress protein YciG